MGRTVVILGAGWVGLPLAHKLLKYTLPKAEDGLKIVLISPNTHFYWNLAAVRGVIPGAIPDEQLFLPIEPGFAHYAAGSFEFILGKAEHLDLEMNVVGVTLNDKMQRSVSYDQLVMATGSQLRSNLAFKPIGAHEETLAALHSLQKQVDVARSIVIGGAGPTGVETAGELAATYSGKKDITLIISEKRVLQGSDALPSVSQAVERDLQQLGVKLVRNRRVEDVEINAKREEEGTAYTRITLSDGSTLATDLYLPLFGVTVNTGFVPKDLLDSSGNLMLDKTMRVMGTKNVWGIGDVGNLEAKQVTVTDAQIIHLSTTLDAVLLGGDRQIKEYKPSEKKMIFITMGRKYATGQIGGWRLWGWIVAYVKGRTLFVDTAEGYVGGKQLRHASM